PAGRARALRHLERRAQAVPDPDARPVVREPPVAAADDRGRPDRRHGGRDLERRPGDGRGGPLMSVFADDLLADARATIGRYPEDRPRSAILPLLYLAQSVEGHVSRGAAREIADLLNSTPAEVEAVASFYTMIRLRPTGTHLVNVCTNLSCALRGANEVYEAAHVATGIPHGGELSDDGVFSVHEEECLGACDAAPVVQIDF